jgi:hypothetical protein
MTTTVWADYRRQIVRWTAVLAAVTVSSLAQAQTFDTPIGKLDFELGVPTPETVTRLYDAMDFQRASQLYLWALPVVGFAQVAGPP